MSIRSSGIRPHKDWRFGVDDTSPIGSDLTKKTLSVAKNAELVEDNLVTKRAGYTPFGDAWGSRVVRGGFNYEKTDGTYEILIYGEDATPSGTSGVLAILNGGAAPTVIVNGLKDNLKPVMFQKDVRLFFYNGQDDFIYNGSTTRQIGIDAPQVAPTFNSFIDGALNTQGSYLYAYSYRNTTTGAESGLSPISSAITTPDNTTQDGVALTILPGDNTLADEILIYRTVAGGTTLYIDGTAAIGATTYNSTVSDAGLGQEAELDNSRPFGPSDIALDADSRVFVRDSENRNRVRHSKIGITGPMFESFQAADFVDCDPQGNAEIITLGLAGKNVIIIKDDSVGKLIPIQAQTAGSLERVGSQKYLYREIAGNVSIAGASTVTSVNNLCVWLGQEDVYATDGVEVFRFGGRIAKTIRKLNFGKGYKFSVINKENTHQLIWSVCRTGQSEPDFQIVAHYRNFPNIAFTFFTPGADVTTHPGIVAASLFEVTLNKEQKVFFGNSSGNGKVYLLNNGNSDDGLGIYWDVRNRWEQGSVIAAHNIFHSMYLFAAGNGNDYNIDMTFEVNGLETIVTTKSTSLITPGSATWGGVNWANFNWAAVAFVPLVFHPKKRAYLARYGFHNYNANEPVVVRGMTTVEQDAPIHR